MFGRKGFTLVEVILVVVIVGILAAIVIPRITYTRAQAQRAACDANVAALNAQIELYHVQEPSGNWPAALGDLITADYIDAIPVCPYNTTYSYDTTSHRVSKHSH